ncbi:hypothetical protein AAG570_004860 [Ranatra chinensis]|uniref:Uncharacterized protein n=1 Tax=Ranatra chinensis TaxID=642074 RepID=A0ABD0XYT1_9HEMI
MLPVQNPSYDPPRTLVLFKPTSISPQSDKSFTKNSNPFTPNLKLNPIPGVSIFLYPSLKPATPTFHRVHGLRFARSRFELRRILNALVSEMADKTRVCIEPRNGEVRWRGSCLEEAVQSPGVREEVTALEEDYLNDTYVEPHPPILPYPDTSGRKTPTLNFGRDQRSSDTPACRGDSIELFRGLEMASYSNVKKVLVVDNVDQSCVHLLRQHGFQVDTASRLAGTELAHRLQDRLRGFHITHRLLGLSLPANYWAGLDQSLSPRPCHVTGALTPGHSLDRMFCLTTPTAPMITLRPQEPRSLLSCWESGPSILKAHATIDS